MSIYTKNCLTFALQIHHSHKMFQIVGYIASIFLALSLIVNGAVKFRTLNMIGQIIFIVYGVLIHANPIIIANAVLLCINIYQLIRLYQSKEQFQYVAIEQNDKIIEILQKNAHSDYSEQALINLKPKNQSWMKYIIARN